MALSIDPALDAATLATRFRRDGRVQIRNFLSAKDAAALHAALVAAPGWRTTANRGDQVVEFDSTDVAGWPPEKHAALDRAVTAGGRYGFQYLYETIRHGDAEIRSGRTFAPVADLAAAMSAPATLAMLRRITGFDDVAFCDAHASRYRAGHFLTTHDDRVDAMKRRAAYVLNLTPEWRADWGGLLLFYDADGSIARGYVPGFNQLTLFAVGQPHNVTMVNALAAAPRYAVTGWLRAA